ncbi:M23 family peptidase [candidate division TA06 bacterium]|uniref:M23 family peptidase n=2 Tax=candidate division TA06 bacterium TaxID=2250710 RepID=A0A523UYH4_UNCT6|nr:MAG: M23 family peptidase [candidate division TA06 bacterium]
MFFYATSSAMGLLACAASVCFLPVGEGKGVTSELRSELAFLNRSLDLTERKLADLEEEMEKRIALDEKVRVVSDLEIIHEEVRSLGVGGTGWHLKRPDLVGPRIGNRLVSIGERIEKLERQARFEQESFEEIVDELAQREKLLAHTPSIMPGQGFITSYFGWRISPITKRREFHRGLDIANLGGTPIVATADGRVTFAGWKKGFGRFLTLDHGYGYITRYGHLKSILVKVGDRVFRGQTIGLLGASGNATGPHVHYEVLVNRRHVNPKGYIHSGLF